jgi:hypothetical protein
MKQPAPSGAGCLFATLRLFRKVRWRGSFSFCPGVARLGGAARRDSEAERPHEKSDNDHELENLRHFGFPSSS